MTSADVILDVLYVDTVPYMSCLFIEKPVVVANIVDPDQNALLGAV